MERLVRDLHFLWRAETIVADIQLRQFSTRAEIRVFAGLCAIFALLMLNLAGFFGLQQWWGPVWAAITVSGADLVVAAALLALSATVKPGRNLELAREVRQMALESMEGHARSAGAFRDDVCRVRASLTALTQSPLDTVLPAIVVPLTRALIKALRKSEPASAAAPALVPVPVPINSP